MGAIVSEITGIFTVRMLLNEKTFTLENNGDYDKINTEIDEDCIEMV